MEPYSIRIDSSVAFLCPPVLQSNMLILLIPPYRFTACHVPDVVNEQTVSQRKVSFGLLYNFCFQRRIMSADQ